MTLPPSQEAVIMKLSQNGFQIINVKSTGLKYEKQGKNSNTSFAISHRLFLHRLYHLWMETQFVRLHSPPRLWIVRLITHLYNSLQATEMIITALVS